MRLAVVADWLPTFAGAEHVIAEFMNLWPEAPLYTTVANHGALGPLDKADIRTSSLQKLYNVTKKHRTLLALMPRAIERIDLRDYDVVLSSSHAIGKGVIPSSHAHHICYCHTPMRYAWEMEDQYLSDFNIKGRLKKYIKRKLMELRRWDMTTATRVDTFIANSSTTQERIKRIYNRESIVIHPPVEDRFFHQPLHFDQDPDAYFLAIGRLVPYKRFGLLIHTANELGLPLKIAGTGQDEARLRKLAGPTVELLGYVPDQALPELYASARALLFPQYEDAGVVPLEAQATGTPVIAYGKGGALDTVIDEETGVFFEEQSKESLAEALDRFSQIEFNPETIRQHAKQFSAERFRNSMREVVDEIINKK